MKHQFTPLLLGCLSLIGASSVHADTKVVFDSLTSTDASSRSNVPLNSAVQTIQIQYAADQLTDMVGATITSIGLRLDIGQTGVPSNTDARSFSDFEIVLAPAAKAFGTFNNTDSFASRMGSGAATVFDEELELAANEPSYNGSAAANDFFTLSFSSGYAYTGGDLIVLIRHTASDPAVTGYFVDAISPADTQAGSAAGKQVYARSANSFGDDTSKINGIAIPVIQFGYTPVPEPSEYAAAAGIGLLAFAAWRRTRRQADVVSA